MSSCLQLMSIEQQMGSSRWLAATAAEWKAAGGEAMGKVD
jgi:hypothetical protein